MRLDQVTKVPFESNSDLFYVDGDNEKYLVKRIAGSIDDVYPGGHDTDLQEDDPDCDRPILEACEVYTMFRICQHTFRCECPDYAKGNDCKHIILGLYPHSKR